MDQTDSNVNFFWSFCPTAMAREAKEGAMFQVETWLAMMELGSKWIKGFLEKNHAYSMDLCDIHGI